MKIQVKIVNAFIRDDQGGNPAGVVLDADHLNHEQKLSIAQKVGLSETAFVSQSQVADYKLDFYTPTMQIAHCGHATIAVFSYLAQTGMIEEGQFTKETIDGNRKITIMNNMAYMEQLAPKYTDISELHSIILKSIGLTEDQLLLAPQKVYTGNSFVIIGVKDVDVLVNLKPKLALIAEVSKKLDLIGYYLFTTQTSSDQTSASARMFAPHYGIEEEAATGMAAGPLACYLNDFLDIAMPQVNIEQGNFMQPPSPSLISVDLQYENDKIQSLMAGGMAKISDEITVDI